MSYAYRQRETDGQTDTLITVLRSRTSGVSMGDHVPQNLGCPPSWYQIHTDWLLAYFVIVAYDTTGQRK